MMKPPPMPIRAIRRGEAAEDQDDGLPVEAVAGGQIAPKRHDDIAEREDAPGRRRRSSAWPWGRGHRPRRSARLVMSHQIAPAKARSRSAMTRPAASMRRVMGVPCKIGTALSLDRRAADEASRARRFRRRAVLALRTSRGRPRSARPSCGPDRRLQELGERVAREIGVVPALRLQDFLPFLGLHHLVHGLGQSLLLVGGDAGRGHDRAPVGDLEVDALILQGRAVDVRQLGGRGDADQAQLAGLDLAFELAVAGNADRDLAAEDGRERFAAARERDVVDLGRVGARLPWRTGPPRCDRRRRPSRRPRSPCAGSALTAAARSLAFLIGQSAGTTRASVFGGQARDRRRPGRG